MGLYRGTIFWIQAREREGIYATIYPTCIYPLHQKRPKTRPDNFLLKDPPHLLQHKLLHLAHILQHLLPILLPPNLALHPYLLQQPPYPYTTSFFPSFRITISVTSTRASTNNSPRILPPQETEMHDVFLLILSTAAAVAAVVAAQVREQRHAVEAQACDVEFERDADEGGHGVVEEDLGGEGEGEGACVGDVQRCLDVEGAGFGFVVVLVVVAAVVW